MKLGLQLVEGVHDEEVEPKQLQLLIPRQGRDDLLAAQFGQQFVHLVAAACLPQQCQQWGQQRVGPGLAHGAAVSFGGCRAISSSPASGSTGPVTMRVRPLPSSTNSGMAPGLASWYWAQSNASLSRVALIWPPRLSRPLNRA